jgi:hypothetical protein
MVEDVDGDRAGHLSLHMFGRAVAAGEAVLRMTAAVRGRWAGVPAYSALGGQADVDAAGAAGAEEDAGGDRGAGGSSGGGAFRAPNGEPVDARALACAVLNTAMQDPAAQLSLVAAPPRAVADRGPHGVSRGNVSLVLVHVSLFLVSVSLFLVHIISHY